ncbi:MAG: hypothetical protein AAGA05_05385 [Pseudomonadota bacterium]
MVIVTHRLDDNTQLYFSSDAQTMLDTFGAPIEILPLRDGKVDLDPFFEGTWEMGDALAANTPLVIGDAPGLFEAMSLMLHPITDKLPMTTPLEGMIAMSVCTAPPLGAPVPVTTMHGYVGYYADIESLDAPIRIEFPSVGRDVLRIDVHEHDERGRLASYSVELKDGEVLTLDAPRTRLATAGIGLLGALGLALATLAVVGVARRGHPARLAG